MPFWCLQLLPKNEQKQVNLRYHSSKVNFIPLFFGRIHGLKICFRVLLTFKINAPLNGVNINQTELIISTLSQKMARDKVSATSNQLKRSAASAITKQ